MRDRRRRETRRSANERGYFQRAMIDARRHRSERNVKQRQVEEQFVDHFHQMKWIRKDQDEEQQKDDQNISCRNTEEEKTDG
jgi:hypothetical protein